MHQSAPNGVIFPGMNETADMQKLPRSPLQFTKCHTDGNDFIIVESSSLNTFEILQPHVLARKICDRRTGIGGDGLILVSLGDVAGNEVNLSLWNSDGSKAEISGNGTCCVAAFVVWRDLLIDNSRFIACTGAGRREVQFLKRIESEFHFVVNMGVPVVDGDCVEMRVRNSVGAVEATVLNVGNPQCALFHEGGLPQDWKMISREIAADARFPNGVNISFSRMLDRHTLATAFFERGAGETFSSGTGSIGAAVSAIVRGFTESPVTVQTASGGLRVMWNGLGSSVELEGHAEVVGEGTFFGIAE